ncbi:hypothetical protein [Pseudomonas oryzihabitans]|uniref:hypothetical protein n=1 Tax=Pseudomonas oryzihabitans TaxID=47885 RepID=UPI0028A762E6|nr:hypothetical protein [Pseudomonas oryzihabitans]
MPTAYPLSSPTMRVLKQAADQFLGEPAPSQFEAIRIVNQMVMATTAQAIQQAATRDTLLLNLLVECYGVLSWQVSVSANPGQHSEADLVARLEAAISGREVPAHG